MRSFILLFSLLFLGPFLNAQEIKENTLTTSADEAPEFPGGSKEMNAFLLKNINFPVKYKSDSLFKGCKVYVKFKIDETGKICNVEILKGCVGFDECDKEALRVMGLMPLWKPATQGGKPIRRGYNLPISFKTN